jgi:hypothetical protein
MGDQLLRVNIQHHFWRMPTMEKDRPKQEQTPTIQLAAVVKDPTKRDWTPYVIVRQPERFLSERLRARAELVRSAKSCGSCGY